MKTKNKTNSVPRSLKKFDAVQFMRQQRDRISEEISNLSPSEIVEYFKIQNSKKRIKPKA